MCAWQHNKSITDASLTMNSFPINSFFPKNLLVLYTPYISRVGCYSRIYQHAKIFSSDPDA